jgi:chemotaxis protein MotB
MARKKKHEEHENHERWLVSYADLMTLLFAFFVVMYSVSRVDNKRMAQAAQSIKWALHHSGTGGVGELPIFEGPPSQGGCVANIGTTAPSNTSEVVKAMEHMKKKLEARLKPFLMDKKLSEAVSVEAVNGKLVVKLAATHFFDPAQAALKPEALPVLDAIADELKQLDRPVRVEAHTDDAPVNGRYRNNWDLSAARASSVTALLENGVGIKPGYLTAAGMGSGHPAVPNDSAEHREANRRVEMVVDVLPADGAAPAAQ